MELQLYGPSPLRSDGIETVRRDAGPHERRTRALRTKFAQGGAIRLKSTRSDDSRDGQAGGWTS
jgi:hypothetical protein